MPKTRYSADNVLGVAQRYIEGEAIGKIAGTLGYSKSSVRNWLYWLVGRETPGYNASPPPYVLEAKNMLGEHAIGKLKKAMDARMQVQSSRRREPTIEEKALEFAVRYKASKEKRGACRRIADEVGISPSLAYAYRQYLFQDKQPPAFKSGVPKYLQNIKRRTHGEEVAERPAPPKDGKVILPAGIKVEIEIRPDGTVFIRK